MRGADRVRVLGGRDAGNFENLFTTPKAPRSRSFRASVRQVEMWFACRCRHEGPRGAAGSGLASGTGVLADKPDWRSAVATPDC